MCCQLTPKVSRVAAGDVGIKFSVAGNSAAPACYWAMFDEAYRCEGEQD